MRDFTGDYASLLKGFARFRAAAQSLESPNLEDDDFVRMAIVGFSINAPTDAWSRQHFDLVNRHRKADFSDDSLEFLHADQAHNYALFSGLCLGYLLGLFESGRLNETEFAGGEAQLSGFMASTSGALP